MECSTPSNPSRQNRLAYYKAQRLVREERKRAAGQCYDCDCKAELGNYCLFHFESRKAIRRARKSSHLGRLEQAIHRRLKNTAKTSELIPFRELVGCNSRELAAHLESLWKPGMDWSNYGWGNGKWQLDHIRPICSFDRTSREGLKAAFHFSNTQPLWHEENMEKAASIPGESSSGIAMCS